jgi:hypothetical protein
MDWIFLLVYYNTFLGEYIEDTDDVGDDDFEISGQTM